jgi:hypothetical protein
MEIFENEEGPRETMHFQVRSLYWPRRLFEAAAGLERT